MEWLKHNWQSLVFNISETILIFCIGLILRLPIPCVVIIMLIFLASRGFFGKALHFKTWYRCLTWSTLIMLSLFVSFKQDILMSYLFAVFSALIMTGKANLKDMYLWNNKCSISKYEDIINFIKSNEDNNNLIEFENKIETRDGVDYLIYKYKFKEGKTFKEMNELLDMENPRIVEHLDKIAYAIRVYFDI